MDLIIKSAFRQAIRNVNEYSKEFHCYPFLVKLDRCGGSCNTINDLSIKVCVPNKTEELNISVFNMITGINESKTLIKHISCECKCKLDGTKCNSNQLWSNDKCKCKKHHICQKDYVWNLATCSCEYGEYLDSIMDDSEILRDDFGKSYDEEIKTISKNLMESK